MALTALQGVLGPVRAAHLLRRATFGPTIEQINQFSNLSAQAAVSILFDEPTPDPVLPINPETGQEWVISGVFGQELSDNGLKRELLRWLVGLSLDVDQPLSFNAREKIVFFLHSHFTTQAEKVGSSRALYFQNELFRQFAFDKNNPVEFNFKALIKKISIDNAMLIFLDGDQNLKGSPNENYARELLELYSIGRGLEGTFPGNLAQGDYVNFTEQDVQAAARILSGFRIDKTFANIDPETGLPMGSPAPGSHDNDPKQFSGRFNDTVISPDPALMPIGEPTAESMLDEVDQLIEMVFSQQESALHICRKIYRFYVYHEIDQELQNTIISDMAVTFIANGYKLQPVIEELLQSEHFFEAANPSNVDDKFGAIIKSPLDLIANTMRFFKIELADHETNYDLFYSQVGQLLQQMNRMGMNYYEPFEVAGYMAYHQYPIYNRSWISSNYLANRYDFIRGLITTSDQQNPDMPGVDLIQFTKASIANGTASNARDLIIAYIQYLFPVHSNLTFDTLLDDNAGLTAERLNYFLQAFLFEPQIDADPEAEWPIRYNGAFEMGVVEAQLVKLINVLLQTPEFQLM